MEIDPSSMNEVVHLIAKLITKLKQAKQQEFALELEQIRERLIMSLETDK